MKKGAATALAALALALPLFADGLRITSTMVGTLRPGQSAKITWTVLGTTKPVHLSLRNANPESGSLQGGEVQTVTTSGGKRNTVTRKVTGIQPGVFNIDAKFAASERPKDIVSAFRKETKRIAEKTRRAAKRLRVRDGRVQIEELVAVLDSIRTDLTNALPYLEMAPFRDAAAELLDDVQREAEAEQQARGAFVLVAQRAPDARIAAPRARSLLERIAEFFSGNGSRSPLGTICVVTVPDGADVSLHPPSIPDDVHSVRATSRLTLYLGKYAYAITREGYARSTGVVHLLTSTERVFECTLPHPCTQLAEPVEKYCR